MEKIRLFVAIELPGDVKQEIGRFQSRLRQSGLENLKWVAPEGLHITLKFLGNTSSGLVSDIEKSLEGASERFAPIDIGIKGLGAFPGLSRARVLWVGLTGELGRLQLLAEEVEGSLVSLGFIREKRRFTPHLTIARVRPEVTPAELGAISDAVSHDSFNLGYPLKVGSLSLMQSQLYPDGARYTRLHLAKFKAR